MNEQISIFDITMPMISIPNRIRLIELFAGYGSHAMVLEEIKMMFSDLCAECEKQFTIEDYLEVMP